MSARAVRFTGPIADAFRSSIEVLARSVSAVIYVVVFLLPWVIVGTMVWWLAARLRSHFGGAATPGSNRP